jgi:PAS domain S-box-containing protein
MIGLLQTRYYWLAPTLFWLALTGMSLAWNSAHIEQTIREIALERGRLMYEMVRQTKIDPVIMTNNPDIFKNQTIENIGYRLVSLNPMNPENSANSWEKEALLGFKTDDDYKFSQTVINGELMFRYAGPVFLQQDCLLCHGGEGVKVGDLRGGISVIVKGQPLYDAHSEESENMVLLHLGSLLLLASLTIFFMSQLRKNWLLLTETRDQLHQKENFLREVTNSMGEGFLVVGLDDIVTYANPESEWLLGWEEQEMEGRNLSELVYTNKAITAFNAGKDSIAKTKIDGISRREDDAEFKHKNGHSIPIAYSVSAMHDEGKLSGVVITFNDISERKRNEDERRQLERELGQTHKMEAIGQLAGGIAHEINTPIQYVGDNLNFLKDAFKDMDKVFAAYKQLMDEAEKQGQLQTQVEKVKKIIEEADLEYLHEETPVTIEQSISGAKQVARIVLAMKDFAHPGATQASLTDVNKLITTTSVVCKNEWKLVADVDLQLDENLPEVNCMGGEISQVLLVLIVNAAHAIEEANREEKGKITITSRMKGKKVEVRVQDTGTGIPENIRESVFNPFFTTKDVGKGTGQGLAIAQDIVVGKHGGELLFETEDGVGTTFILRLPI